MQSVQNRSLQNSPAVSSEVLPGNGIRKSHSSANISSTSTRNLEEENFSLLTTLRKLQQVSHKAYEDIVRLRQKNSDLENERDVLLEQLHIAQRNHKTIEEQFNRREEVVLKISSTVRKAVNEFNELKAKYEDELLKRQHVEEIMALQQQRIAVLEEGLGVKNSVLKNQAPTFNTAIPPVTSSSDNTAIFSASTTQTQHQSSSKQPEVVQKIEERLDPATFKDELSKIRSQLNDSAAEFSRFKELALAKQQVLEDTSRSPLPSSPQLRPPKSPPKGSPKPSRPPPSVPRSTTAQISPRRMDSAKLQEELTKRRSTLNRVPQPRESRCFATGSRPSSQFITGPVGQLTALLSTISKQLSLHSRVSPPPTSALPAIPTYEKTINLTHPTPVTQPNTATQPSQPSQGHAKDIQSLFFMLEKELTVIEEEVKNGKQNTS